MKSITIRIEDPEELNAKLADLLCWYSGFSLGLKFNGQNLFVQDRALERLQKIQFAILEAMKRRDNDLKNNQ